MARVVRATFRGVKWGLTHLFTLTSTSKPQSRATRLRKCGETSEFDPIYILTNSNGSAGTDHV